MSRVHHLAIDAVGAKHGGAASVVLATLAAAECVDIEHVTLFCSPKSERRFTLPVADWLDVEDRPGEERSTVARLGWLAGGCRAIARRRGADALLSLSSACGGASELPTTVFAQQPVPLSAEAMARLDVGNLVRMVAIRTLLYDACQRADCLAVQTPWMRDALVSQFGARPDRVVVVGTASKPLRGDGVPTRVGAKLKGARGSAVLYVGSDASYKNLALLPPAMRQIRRSRPHARLFVTLPEGHPLESDDVVCLGYLNDQDLAAAYAAADVFVLPSLVESAGLPLIEAMALGVPVVVADRPYGHDMCGDAALYFNPTDPGTLADRILVLLGDEALRARLRDAGIVRAEQFRAARPYERLVELAISAGECAGRGLHPTPQQRLPG